MAKTQFKFDVFISYSDKDEEWVEKILLPALEDVGLKVCFGIRDFDAGIPSLVNMENAVENSRYTLTVLTPNWLNSDWSDFESLLTGTNDPAGRRKKLIPIMLDKCKPPKRISMLTYVDFTRKDREVIAWKQLFASLGINPKADTSLIADLVLPQILQPKVRVSKFNVSNINKLVDTINAHHIVELFHDMINPDSQYRILFIEGEEKLGKSHIVTKVFPWVSIHDNQYICAIVDLRNKLYSIYDILNQMSAQLHSKIDLQNFTSAYEDWVKNSSTNKDWSTYLTGKLASDLQRENQANILIIFDQLDDSNEETQRWLREVLLVQLFPLENVRVVVSGRQTLAPSSIYHHTCQIHKLELIDDQDEYVNYCRRLGIGDELQDQSIKDFARLVGYRPGLFAELLWATYIK